MIMANTDYAYAWVFDTLLPGDPPTTWIRWGFNRNDVISVTAYPFQRGGPTGRGSTVALRVENVQIEIPEDGFPRLYFDVRNVGPNYVTGYAIVFSFVSA